jgi:ABC-type multidrug transport system permease subunit
MSGIAFAIGFRLHSSIAEALLAFALMVLFGFAFEWVFVTLGLYAGNAQAAQGMSLLLIPFVFVSTAFVPLHQLPGWMRGVGRHQPVTYMVEAVRSLTQGDAADALLGHSTSYYVIRSLIWSVVLVAVFGPIAVARYRKG